MIRTKQVEDEAQAWQVAHCAWDWRAPFHGELESWHDAVIRRTTDAGVRFVRPVKIGQGSSGPSNETSQSLPIR